MALDQLAVGMTPIVVSPLLYKCFQRPIKREAELLVEALHEIHPSTVRALAVFVRNNYPAVKKRAPSVYAFAE